MHKANKQALVLGGSIAGLLAARVLSQHFDQVTLIERDALTEGADSRKGAPQGRHIHALLAKGYLTLLTLFPNFKNDLLAAGAVICDIANDVYWYQGGGYSVNFQSGVDAVFISRPALEQLIRQRVLALPNVTLRAGCAVTDATISADRQQVTGVTVQDRQTNQTETLVADLVVDATGRGSALLKWLTNWGYATPSESVVEVGVSYATRTYRRTVPDDQAKAWLSVPVAPLETRGGGVFPIEGERWLVTLSGYRGDAAPTDEASFVDYARSLPAQEIYELIKNAEPLSPIAPYQYPASRRRHYEQLTRFPANLIALGDAVASFNPIYGQGMTVCALEALALDEWLRAAVQSQQAPDTIRFFQAIGKVLDTPWTLATSADTVKERPNLLDRYFDRLKKVSLHDPVVKLAFMQVAQLLLPPSALVQPKIALRVLLGGWPRGQKAQNLKTAWQGG